MIMWCWEEDRTPWMWQPPAPRWASLRPGSSTPSSRRSSEELKDILDPSTLYSFTQTDVATLVEERTDMLEFTSLMRLTLSLNLISKQQQSRVIVIQTSES